MKHKYRNRKNPMTLIDLVAAPVMWLADRVSRLLKHRKKT